MTRRAPLPPGHVRMIDLLGVCPVGYPIADDNASRWVHPMRPRRGRPGLVPFNAPGLWRAIRAGKFPAPVSGPWGVAWQLAAVDRWRLSQTTMPPAALTAGGTKNKLQEPNK